MCKEFCLPLPFVHFAQLIFLNARTVKGTDARIRLPALRIGNDKKQFTQNIQVNIVKKSNAVPVDFLCKKA